MKDVAMGMMEPAGQLVLTLKLEEQSASRGDVTDIRAQLAAIPAAVDQLAASR